MKNKDVRSHARARGVHLWQVAERYNGGMLDSNFSRILRHELPESEKEKIRAIIEQIGAEGGSNGENENY